MLSPKEHKAEGIPRTGSSVGDIIEAAKKHPLLSAVIASVTVVVGGAWQFFLSLEQTTKLEAINGGWAKTAAFLQTTTEVNRLLLHALIGWSAWWLLLTIWKWVSNKWFKSPPSPVLPPAATQQPSAHPLLPEAPRKSKRDFTNMVSDGIHWRWTLDAADRPIQLSPHCPGINGNECGEKMTAQEFDPHGPHGGGYTMDTRYTCTNCGNKVVFQHKTISKVEDRAREEIRGMLFTGSWEREVPDAARDDRASAESEIAEIKAEIERLNPSDLTDIEIRILKLVAKNPWAVSGTLLTKRLELPNERVRHHLEDRLKDKFQFIQISEKAPHRCALTEKGRTFAVGKGFI